MRPIRFSMALVWLTLSSAAFSDALTPGNIVISTDDAVFETTLNGNVVQSFPLDSFIPYAYPVGGHIAVDEAGSLHVFQSPYWLDFNPATGSWRTTIVQDTGYREEIRTGIDVFESIYGPQLLIVDPVEFGGILAYDIIGGPPRLRAQDVRAIDLQIGLDELLYVLTGEEGSTGTAVNIYYPYTFNLQDSVDLTTLLDSNDHRAIAAGQFGVFYLADSDGEIHRITPAPAIGGSVTTTTITPTCYDDESAAIPCVFTDITVSANSEIVLGTEHGSVVVTDTNFSTVSTFEISDGETYVSFVPGPVRVPLDIQPGRFPNKVRLSRKHLWLSIDSDVATYFDPLQIDPATVRLGVDGATANRSSTSVDNNNDGVTDLRMRFRIRDIGTVCGDTQLSLTASTYDGQNITATDSIVTINCD